MTENLYDDANAMLEVSELIYFIAGLRKAKKDKKAIHHAEYFGELPKTSIEVAKWVDKNRNIIDIDEFNNTLLDNLLKRDGNDPAGVSSLEVFDDDFAWAGRKSEVVYGITTNPDKKRISVDSEGVKHFAWAGTKSEVVYAITTNPDKKRISVVFRGSQTKSDWIQNFRIRNKHVELNEDTFKDIPNANLELLKGTDDVIVHSGFVQYLFEEHGRDGSGEKTEEPKALQIVKHVTRLLEKNPDYELWFSGHSLGGALATLGAAYAAASNDIKKPIKLITFASPEAGKSRFVEAMDKLEAAKVLLHLRVTNNDDLVPQLLGMVGYKHFGLHLNLFNSKHTLSFDQGGMHWPWIWQVLNRHDVQTYFERLQQTKEEVKNYEFDTVFETIREKEGK
eukprot:CAMPEP_0185740978 /NCGR_PEP_ID=MMETSP1171-20130828/38711_1 /TAXON_ID=374046 /ORGANISM="Helicotheca tamensis, Strain CCMP826" /LENGTH=392 /DNA_ID=CAMNT_0028412915 /DNA_START=111 /DNA_END=1290 /DNA_ORIENTATION=-